MISKIITLFQVTILQISVSLLHLVKIIIKMMILRVQQQVLYTS